MRSRRGQEEVVGFIAVVVLVVIVFIVFLSLNANKPAEVQDSTEISQFLEGAFQYTSQCALNYAPNYLTIGELLEACYMQKSCASGENSCEVLTSVLKEMIPSSLKIEENRPRSAYTFKAVYVSNEELESGQQHEIVSLSEKGCESNKIGTVKTLPADEGVIRATLEVC